MSLIFRTGESMQLSTKAHLFEAVDNDHNKRRYTIMFEALLMGHDDWVYSVCWQPPIAVTGKFEALGLFWLHCVVLCTNTLMI